LFDDGKLQPSTTFAVETAQWRKERAEAAGARESSIKGSMQVPSFFTAVLTLPA
jgi:hypothetical protein